MKDLAAAAACKAMMSKLPLSTRDLLSIPNPEETLKEAFQIKHVSVFQAFIEVIKRIYRLSSASKNLLRHLLNFFSLANIKTALRSQGGVVPVHLFFELGKLSYVHEDSLKSGNLRRAFKGGFFEPVGKLVERYLSQDDFFAAESVVDQLWFSELLKMTSCEAVRLFVDFTVFYQILRFRYHFSVGPEQFLPFLPHGVWTREKVFEVYSASFEDLPGVLNGVLGQIMEKALAMRDEFSGFLFDALEVCFYRELAALCRRRLGDINNPDFLPAFYFYLYTYFKALALVVRARKWGVPPARYLIDV